VYHNLSICRHAGDSLSLHACPKMEDSADAQTLDAREITEKSDKKILKIIPWRVQQTGQGKYKNKKRRRMKCIHSKRETLVKGLLSFTYKSRGCFSYI